MRHADRILDARRHAASLTEEEEEAVLSKLQTTHATFGEPFLFLALADGKLRRVTFDISEDNAHLRISPGLAEINVPDRRAVVYMDDGDYVVHVTRADGQPCKPHGIVVDHATPNAPVVVPCA